MPRPSNATLIATIAGLVTLLAITAAALLIVRRFPPGTRVAGQLVTSTADVQEAARAAADAVATHPITLLAGEGSEVGATAADLGIALDVEATTAAVDDLTGFQAWVERITDGPLVVDMILEVVDGADLSRVADELDVAPVDGALAISRDGVEVTDPQPGRDVAADDVRAAIQPALESLSRLPVERWPRPLVVRVDGAEVAPTIGQPSIDAALRTVERLTATPVTVTGQVVPEDGRSGEMTDPPQREDASVTLDVADLRQMLTVETDPDAIEADRLRVVPTAAQAPEALTEFLQQAALPPMLDIRVENRAPTPGRGQDVTDLSTATGDLVATMLAPGFEPDLDRTVEAILEAVAADRTEAPVVGREVPSTDPALLGITQPVSTFTTFYTPGESRVTNIHRIAELVDGTLIPPGGNYELNHAVGPRTPERGFVPAGAILEGEFITDVGGGVSQFATTFFNAMWFAGLDIITHQPHSYYFERYPLGREATINYPGVNLEVNNNTPYWVLVDTAVTADSVTVTFWSTPYFEVESHTGERVPTDTGFRVTVSRRVTGPDGFVDEDEFTAHYRTQ